jgi:hypothetical protein
MIHYQPRLTHFPPCATSLPLPFAYPHCACGSCVSSCKGNFQTFSAGSGPLRPPSTVHRAQFPRTALALRRTFLASFCPDLSQPRRPSSLISPSFSLPSFNLISPFYVWSFLLSVILSASCSALQPTSLFDHYEALPAKGQWGKFALPDEHHPSCAVVQQTMCTRSPKAALVIPFQTRMAKLTVDLHRPPPQRLPRPPSRRTPRLRRCPRLRRGSKI